MPYLRPKNGQNLSVFFFKPKPYTLQGCKALTPNSRDKFILGFNFTFLKSKVTPNGHLGLQMNIVPVLLGSNSKTFSGIRDQGKVLPVLSINILAFYQECRSRIGYATHYLFCCRQCVAQHSVLVNQMTALLHEVSVKTFQRTSRYLY